MLPEPEVLLCVSVCAHVGRNILLGSYSQMTLRNSFERSLQQFRKFAIVSKFKGEKHDVNKKIRM